MKQCTGVVRAPVFFSLSRLAMQIYIALISALLYPSLLHNLNFLQYCFQVATQPYFYISCIHDIIKMDTKGHN